MVYLGIDIGGSHIKIGVFSFSKADFQLNKSFSLNINSFKSRESIVGGWRKICVTVKKKYCIVTVGVSFPAPFELLVIGGDIGCANHLFIN